MWFKEISIPTPRKVDNFIRNSKGEGGSKAKDIKGKYDEQLEFPEEWGHSNQKTLYDSIHVVTQLW